MIDDLAFIPLLYFSFHNIVSSRYLGGKRMPSTCTPPDLSE